jgi:hypothetical protein
MHTAQTTTTNKQPVRVNTNPKTCFTEVHIAVIVIFLHSPGMKQTYALPGGLIIKLVPLTLVCECKRISLY